MTVKELMARLSKLPKNMEVVMSSDAEGNNHSPLSDLWIGYYTPDNGWSGEFYFEADMNEDDINNLKAGSTKVVCLTPIN